MGRSASRGLVNCLLAVLFPISSFSADSNPAMLYTNGAAWINGSHVPRPSLAIFSGDLLQTRADSVANINEPGSTVSVLGDSAVKFEGSAVRVNHGGVRVSTSRQLSTTAGDVKVTPASNTWTEFSVTDFDGTVQIVAQKGDVTVSDGKQTVTLAQGQQTTRDETASDNSDKSSNKSSQKQQSGAPAGASGGILNSPLAVGLGGAAVGAVTTFVLVKNGNPASPAKPK